MILLQVDVCSLRTLKQKTDDIATQASRRLILNSLRNKLLFDAKIAGRN